MLLATAVPGLEARELELRHRGCEVVADSPLVVEELGGHHRTNGVAAEIGGVGSTRSIAEPPGHWVGATGLQLGVQDVAFDHGRSFTQLSGAPDTGG